MYPFLEFIIDFFNCFSMSTTKIFHTTGMHCKSCEMMVREGISEIDGCELIAISSKTGKVTIDFLDESVEPQVREVIRSL